MKAITYAKAHFFHSSEAICKLALKGHYDKNKAYAEISEKLQAVSNSDTKRSGKYLQQLDMLKADKSSLHLKESEAGKSSLHLKESEAGKFSLPGIKLSSAVHPPVATARSAPSSTLPGRLIKRENKTITSDFIKKMSAPEVIKDQIEKLKNNINNVLECEDINAVNKSNKLRPIMTNLQYFSDYSVENDHKETFSVFLEQKVAGQPFVTFGDQKLTKEKQLQFVKAHLINIQRWINQETTAVCEGSSTA